MADQKIILSVDDDWKRQAQEEKKRLAEQEQATATAEVTPAPTATEQATPAGRRTAAAGEIPTASFAAIAQSMLTQTLYFLGDLAGRGGQPMMNLDMARYQIDQLTILEQKTKGNLAADEQQFLDSALYEARNRFVAVASQLIGP